MVLESGAINAAFLFAYVIMLVTNSSGLELVSEMVRLFLIPLARSPSPFSLLEQPSFAAAHGDVGLPTPRPTYRRTPNVPPHFCFPCADQPPLFNRASP